MRDVKRLADEGHALIAEDGSLDMGVDELQQLQRIARGYGNEHDGVFRAIGAAYYMGLKIGYDRGRYDQ
ncbi:MAG: hypothetical protein MJ128_06795 [Mogibacterium sp.]|nr:hypothetical protein [Mogibacterium sp.]